MIGLKPPHRPGVALFTWSGPTSGSQDMSANPILYFAAVPGTYTLNVGRAMTLEVEICGNGARGGPGFLDAPGGYGGGCGEVRKGTFYLVPSEPYILHLQGENVGAVSHLSHINGTRIMGAGGANSQAAPVPGTGGAIVFPGRAGGDGSLWHQFGDGAGEPGTFSGSYSPGSGGGGGSSSSTLCGKGGDGGGNPGSGAPPPVPGPFVPCIAGAGGRGIGWRVFGVGYGGGGGASGDVNTPPSGGTVGHNTPGGHGGAFFKFIS